MLISRHERGASALLVAITMLLLLGFAAIAIDVGSAFADRRQNQTAADVSVMAGALEMTLPQSTNSDVVDQVLRIARKNVTEDYINTQWQAAWQLCSDANRPPEFAPMPDPWNPGNTLDCISVSSSFLRVRVPNQIADTRFGRVLGADTITTNATAVAIIESLGGLGSTLPFGVPGGAQNGELCIGQAPGGIAQPPCDSPTTGEYGTLLSEFFHDLYEAPYSLCTLSMSGADNIAIQTALGMDHFIRTWPNDITPPYSRGDAYPGKDTVESLPDVVLDECTPTAGGEPNSGGTVNTVKVDSGNNWTDAIQRGLVSDETFSYTDTGGVPSSVPSRLQQQSDVNKTRRIVAKRAGGPNVEIWELDNVDPWSHLIDTGAGDECDGLTYAGLADTQARVDRFNECLTTAYPGGVIFEDTIDDSPRFARLPQFWFELPAGGCGGVACAQPVWGYRMIYIAGIWFKSGSISFYPDLAEYGPTPADEICDSIGGGHCAQLALSQVTAWLLPDTAVPASVVEGFPSGNPAFTPSLWR